MSGFGSARRAISGPDHFRHLSRRVTQLHQLAGARPVRHYVAALLLPYRVLIDSIMVRHLSHPPEVRRQTFRSRASSTITDTADFYGPHITNELIREALVPYPDDLHIVTKVGARRDEQGGWPHARTPAELRTAVHDNLRGWGCRCSTSSTCGSVAGDGCRRARLDRGAVRSAGGASAAGTDPASWPEHGQRRPARGGAEIAPVVCVQNFYNIAHREDDALVDLTASQGIAYVPYFPLGGFSPLQSGVLARWLRGLRRLRWRSRWHGCCGAHRTCC